MSYFTWVSLTLKNATVFQARDIEKRLEALDAIGREFTPRHGLHFDAFCEIDGWYPTCEPRFMKKVSREFPDVHFIIHGEGEVINGMRSPFWTQHYLGGKCYLNASAVSLRLFSRKVRGALSKAGHENKRHRGHNPVMASRVYRKLEADPAIYRPISATQYPEGHGNIRPLMQRGEA